MTKINTMSHIRDKSFRFIRDFKRYLPKIPIPPLISTITKNDKIMAMRKQYEAFLEEDKKRKQRNEYILGKLDTMRSCTIVQRHRLPTMFVDEPCFVKRPTPSSRCHAYLKDDPQYKSQLSIPIKNIEDSALLSEITKKFLLIPKLGNVYNNNYTDENLDIKPSVDDNWKSKYEILNTLKQNEKEEPPEKLVEDLLLADTKQCNLAPSNKIVSKEIESNEINSHFTYAPELPVRDLQGPEANVVYNALENESDPGEKHKIYAERNNLDTTQAMVEPSQYATTTSESVGYYDPQPVGYENTSYVFNKEPEYGSSNIVEQPNLSNDLTANVDDIKMDQVSQEHPTTYDGEQHETNIIDDIRVAQLDNEEGSIIEPSNVTHENMYNYPIEVINSDEFTPTEDVKLVDGVNINPEGQETLAAHLESQAQNTTQSYSDESVEHNQQENNLNDQMENATVQDPQTIENPQIDQAAIDAFEAEQSEMFYQEEGSNIAPHAEAPDYAHNYEGDEQYLNYDNTQQGIGYPEINEHEETNERYDQMYEQQYNYEQPQQQQQYDETGYEQTGYDQTEYPQQVAYNQGYEYDQDYQQQNYETTDHIQQQLDNEQGYTEPVEQVYTESTEQQGYVEPNEQTYHENIEQVNPEKIENIKENQTGTGDAKIANTEAS